MCKYKKTNEMVILKNINCKSDSCINVFTIDIPPQTSKKCNFLNEEKRIRRFAIGPSYPTAYEKYGLVPDIDIDTAIIIKNKLIFFKQKEHWGSIGFVLK
jgi:hypothetical protein